MGRYGNEYPLSVSTGDGGHIQITAYGWGGDNDASGEIDQPACAPLKPQNEWSEPDSDIVSSLRQLDSYDMARIKCPECRWLVTRMTFKALADGVTVSFK